MHLRPSSFSNLLEIRRRDPGERFVVFMNRIPTNMIACLDMNLFGL